MQRKSCGARLKDRFPASSFGTVLPYENLNFPAQMGFHQSQMVTSQRGSADPITYFLEIAYPARSMTSRVVGSFRSKAADSQTGFLSLDGAVCQRNEWSDGTVGVL